MITVDELANAANSGNVIFHEFLQFYRADRPIVYGIVEGRDDPAFYRGAVTPSLPDGWIVKLIPAGTKKKVLEAYKIREWNRYPNGCICFFVDRDFSEFLSETYPAGENLYVSDHYSIECELVNFRVAHRTLEEIMGVTKLTIEESDNLELIFNSNLEIFEEALVPLMAQIIDWRRNGLRPNLKDFDPCKFFAYTDGVISIKPEFSSNTARLNAMATALGLRQSADSIIERIEQEFREASKIRCNTRGKYLLKFLVEVLASIHSSISKFCARHPHPPRVAVSIGPGNAMAEMALRARCPDSLKEFVDKNYVAFIRTTNAA